MNKEPRLITFTLSLTASHLGLAFESLDRINKMDWRSKNSISAILHGYCALESAINFIGYEMFRNTESSQYIKEEDRDVPLKRLIKSWNNSVSCIDKFDFLLSLKSSSIPPKLKNELVELNNLRNWISHGFSYQTTWLVDATDGNDSQGPIHDYEYSVNWGKKFPILKFNSLDELDLTDAKKALMVIIESIKFLAVKLNQPFYMSTYINKPDFNYINKETDPQQLINKYCA